MGHTGSKWRITSMNKREDLIEELNQLLKGTHMGAFIFEDLHEKIMDPELAMEFANYLRILKRHEQLLTRHIVQLEGDPLDTSGIKGTMADLMSMMKNLTLANDEQVLEEALKSIEMGQKALRDFDDRHFNMSENLCKELSIMKDDYSIIHHSLHKFITAMK